MKVLVVAKNKISSNKATVSTLTKLLDKKKINYQVISFDEVEDFYAKIHERTYKNTFDMLLSFGGDGTILKTARVARKLDIPILGVNVGTIGFLTSVADFSDLDVAIDKIKSKNYSYEERSMIDARVYRDGKEIFKSYAVNEATFMTVNIGRMAKYKITVGKENSPLTEMNADGLIIATPTGSTAHSFSAGGPIVSPSVNCFIITALYPHTLNQRSIVVSDNKELYVNILSDEQIVDIDGRVEYKLNTGDIVKIKKLKKTIRYIVFDKNNFINNIREKIKAL